MYIYVYTKYIYHIRMCVSLLEFKRKLKTENIIKRKEKKQRKENVCHC